MSSQLISTNAESSPSVSLSFAEPLKNWWNFDFELYYSQLEKVEDGILYQDLNKLEEFWEVMDQWVSLSRDEAKKNEALNWLDEMRTEVKMGRLHAIQKLVW